MMVPSGNRDSVTGGREGSLMTDSYRSSDLVVQEESCLKKFYDANERPWWTLPLAIAVFTAVNEQYSENANPEVSK
jgi:hypothetical protein